MTVCVALKVNDCIVFGADSATSMVQTDQTTGKSEVVNVYDHGNKVFNLYKGLPISAMTCGMGNIGNVSISTIAKELRVRLRSDDTDWRLNEADYTIEQIAVKARKLLFEERFGLLAEPPAQPHELEFWIGGYSSDKEHGEVWKVVIYNGQCSAPIRIINTDEIKIAWGGAPEAINRLVSGYSQQLPMALLAAGITEAALPALMQRIVGFTMAPILEAAMPIQDAIQLTDFLIETTKFFVRFMPGANTVGGNTDLCVVTKYEGFKWIRRKHFYPINLNALESDHADRRT